MRLIRTLLALQLFGHRLACLDERSWERICMKFHGNASSYCGDTSGEITVALVEISGDHQSRTERRGYPSHRCLDLSPLIQTCQSPTSLEFILSGQSDSDSGNMQEHNQPSSCE